MYVGGGDLPGADAAEGGPGGYRASGDADWLAGAFRAADLIMASGLIRLRACGILDEFPTLAAYVARGEARPAYQRAFADQYACNNRP